MPVYTGQAIQQIFPHCLPRRIVCAVPSLTELLFDLGLDPELAGITRYCVRPASWQASKAITGGTKNLDLALIRSLQPDLIIANKEENEKVQVEELALHYPVWLTDICNREEACQVITRAGELVGRQERAAHITATIQRNFNQWVRPQQKTRVCYLLWRKPYMTAGGDTFINAMLEEAGFENIFKNESRYPVVSLEEIARRKPAFIFLSSEPFPFREKHMASIRTDIPGAEYRLVDGEMFSWYGSRMIHAPAYFLNLWHGLYGK